MEGASLERLRVALDTLDLQEVKGPMLMARPTRHGFAVRIGCSDPVWCRSVWE